MAIDPSIPSQAHSPSPVGASSCRPAQRPEPSRWNLPQAFAGWFVPGLGHLLVNQKAKAAIIGITIMLTWLGGLLIGGISSINRTEHPFWFGGQVLVAPSLLVDLYRGLGPVPKPHQPGHYTPSLGRLNEMGTLLTTMAGLLNLLAIVDVAYRQERSPGRQAGER